MAELRPGDSAEAVIERVVPGGEGLARLSGVVTLVPGGLPGDRVRVRVTAASPRLVRATLEEVVAPGEARRLDAELCPRARDASCGGCDWPAARLEHHREMKTSLVLDALRRLGGLRPEELPEPGWRGSARNYRLRNRLHLDRDGRLGFFAPRSRIVSNLEVCEIVSKALLARLPAIRAHLSGLGPVEGELWTLESRDGAVVLGELRLASEDGGGRPGISLKVKRGPFDGFRVVDAGGRVVGSDGPSELMLSAGGAAFEVSVSSFFQGNLYLLDAFLEEIRTALRAAEEERNQRPFRAVDLYAGVGFLTRPLLELGAEAGGGAEVTAVEIEPSSSNSLSKNLFSWSSSGLPLARAVRASAESFLSSYSQKSPSSSSSSVDILVADPPRAGLSPAVRAGILRLAPGRLLMVSCDPPTLARDLAALKSRYAVERLTLLDLFPQTHHVETIALLVRRKVG
ncbi:MAG: TRAM domain-containing protein [Thermoanaerobaculia bacterium]|nr:TRAM domain-containing protein [Thermoanaerobaculia bacterium]